VIDESDAYDSVMTSFANIAASRSTYSMTETLSHLAVAGAPQLVDRRSR